MNFSENLKLKTSTLHQETDKLFYSLLKKNHLELPEVFAAWYLSLTEGGILASQPQHISTDLKFARVLDLLPTPKLKTAVNFKLENEYQWLGCYYVVRGSANGSRILRTKLPSSHLMMPYLNYMGTLSQEPWSQLKSELDQVSSTNEDIVIKSASNTFLILLTLLKKINQ